MEYNSAIKRNVILPFATTWMELKGIMLSEIRQRKDKYHMISLVWNLRNTTDEHTGRGRKNTIREKTERETNHKRLLNTREQTEGCQRGVG